MRFQIRAVREPSRVAKRRALAIALAIVMSAVLLPASTAHAMTNAGAQDCIQAGGTLPAPPQPPPVGGPACSDALDERAGVLYWWEAAGGGVGIYGGGVVGYDVIEQDMTASTTGTVSALARLSLVTPPDAIVPIPVAGGGVVVSATFRCVTITDRTRSTGDGSCYSPAYAAYYGGDSYWNRPPVLEVSQGDALHVRVSLFNFMVDRTSVCFLFSCVAGVAGPSAVTAHLDGIDLR